MRKQKLIRISEEVLDNGTKVVVIGDKETQGSSFATAYITFPKEPT
jgi:hypothetical protein